LTASRSTSKGRRLCTAWPTSWEDIPRPDGDGVEYRGVPGIHYRVWERGWVDAARAWFLAFTPHDFFRQEYFTSFLHVAKALRHRAQVDKLVRWVNSRPPGVTLRLVGHSFATDIILSALPHFNRRIDEIHLIAGAVEHDFFKNNLAAAIAQNKVGLVCIYASRGDRILKYLARTSRWIFGRLGYGYIGWMASHNLNALRIQETGLGRISFLDDARAQVIVFNSEDPHLPTTVRIIIDDTIRHCDWFKPENFEHTMRRLRDHGILPAGRTASEEGQS
jgi:hypothetical protein